MNFYKIFFDVVYANFFITFNVLFTSLKSNKLNIFDLPSAIDDSNKHLILKLLSLDTSICFLNGFIGLSILI